MFLSPAVILFLHVVTLFGIYILLPKMQHVCDVCRDEMAADVFLFISSSVSIDFFSIKCFNVRCSEKSSRRIRYRFPTGGINIHRVNINWVNKSIPVSRAIFSTFFGVIFFVKSNISVCFYILFQNLLISLPINAKVSVHSRVFPRHRRNGTVGKTFPGQVALSSIGAPIDTHKESSG